MKKLFLSVTLLVALTPIVFAGGNKSDKQTLKDLQKAIQSSTQVAWTNTDDYRKGSFVFNGKSVSGFYDPENFSLIGFSIHIVGNDVPQEMITSIQKKYSDWKIVDAIYFIDGYGNGNYFAQIEKGKNALAIKITNGKAIIYSKMPK